MKYPQSVQLPRDVEDWLEGELEARGIDPVVYTRYILNLMLQDSLDFDLYDYDSSLHLPNTKGVWNGPQLKRTDPAYFRPCDQHAIKRLAVIQCLMAASAHKSEAEALVDELSNKLEEIRDARPSVNDLQPSEFFTYSDSAFPPLVREVSDLGREDKAHSASVWTRGILRASLKAIDTGFIDDDFGAPDYFPLTHSGPKTMHGTTLDLYGPRLYERSVNRSLERVMAGLDATFHQYWNPKESFKGQDDVFSYQRNHTYFQNNNADVQPDFLFGKTQNETIAPVTWSLGGAPTEKNSAPVENISEARRSSEDLLTSTRTHFRPIRSDDSGIQTNNYEDGTTFTLSTEMDHVQFKRSESGSLFLDTGKYMEFKKDDDDGKAGAEEFVPKFRVQQSNEKQCQTDDLSENAEECPTLDTSPSTQEIFFFPGDEQLARDLSEDDYQDEGELVSIVSGRLNVHWKKSVVKTPSPEGEPEWDAEDEAMVDDLVDDSPSWKRYSDCPVSEADDNMEDQASHGNWPQLTDSIWNPKNSTQACESCRGVELEDKSDGSNAVLSKQEWREIWKQPVCNGCKESADNDKKASKELSDLNPVEWPDLDATLSTYLQESRAQAFDLLNVWGPAGASSEDSINDAGNFVSLRELWRSDSTDEFKGSWDVNKITPVGRPCTYNLMRDELSEDGNQLLSDLSFLHLQQIDDSESTEASDIPDDEEEVESEEVEEAVDTFPSGPLCPVEEKGPSFVSLWATWNIIAIAEDKTIFDERIYDTQTAQIERKRRHSSSQKMCDQYLEGECRRSHCRFRHDYSPRFAESVCVRAHSLRYGRELNRAFTF